MANYPINSALTPTTFVWDLSDLYSTDLNNPEQMRELLVRLYQNLNRMQILLNGKDDGTFLTINEMITGQTWFPNPTLNYATSTSPTPRPSYRVMVNFGPLPNTATKSLPHYITCTALTTVTKIYGAASDTTGKTYIPLPYASATGTDNIELFADGTNVNVTTASNRSNFNISYIVIEYLQT